MLYVIRWVSHSLYEGAHNVITCSLHWTLRERALLSLRILHTVELMYSAEVCWPCVYYCSIQRWCIQPSRRSVFIIKKKNTQRRVNPATPANTKRFWYTGLTGSLNLMFKKVWETLHPWKCVGRAVLGTHPVRPIIEAATLHDITGSDRQGSRVGEEWRSMVCVSNTWQFTKKEK